MSGWRLYEALKRVRMERVLKSPTSRPVLVVALELFRVEIGPYRRYAESRTRYLCVETHRLLRCRRRAHAAPQVGGGARLLPGAGPTGFLQQLVRDPHRLARENGVDFRHAGDVSSRSGVRSRCPHAFQTSHPWHFKGRVSTSLRNQGISERTSNGNPTEFSRWRGGRAAALRRAFDESALIFTHRANDLIFQTAAVRLLLPRRKWRHFADFTYQHHTAQAGVSQRVR